MTHFCSDACVSGDATVVNSYDDEVEGGDYENIKPGFTEQKLNDDKDEEDVEDYENVEQPESDEDHDYENVDNNYIKVLEVTVKDNRKDTKFSDSGHDYENVG